jgi:hypothetical protein
MFPFYKLLSVSLLVSTSDLALAAQIAADSVAAQYSLSTTTSLPFPTTIQSTTDAQSFIVSQWSLSKGHIQNGPGNLQFIDDPFPNAPIPALPSSTNTSSPVLAITYPQGSFSSDTSGAQLYQLWNTTDGQPFQSMMVSYDIAFDSGFNWVKGGKLPGLRGGPNSTGCSGGSEPNGSDCFSARIMWRTNGKGEVYAYVPTPNNFCSEAGIICNSDFGISVQRGAFTLASGQWNRITLLVQLNDPPDVANGNMVLYFNDVLAISQRNILYRNSSAVNANGFYLSTFFGGSDSSWATPQTTHSYIRNVRMWAGNAPSNLTGSKVSGAGHLLVEWYWTCVVVVTFIFSYGL